MDKTDQIFLSKEYSQLMKNLEEAGVVEESTSRWCNPVVLTKKKNGYLRFCVDFRRLNDIVESEKFLIPRISDLMSSLHDMKFFSKTDFKDGFFQVSMKPSDREKTAFLAGTRLMQFVKMPQGYKNSIAIFQKRNGTNIK